MDKERVRALKRFLVSHYLDDDFPDFYIEGCDYEDVYIVNWDDTSEEEAFIVLTDDEANFDTRSVVAQNYYGLIEKYYEDNPPLEHIDSYKRFIEEPHVKEFMDSQASLIWLYDHAEYIDIDKLSIELQNYYGRGPILSPDYHNEYFQDGYYIYQVDVM